MAQFDFYDPRTQGLLTLAAGLLSQSGWQPQRTTLGQAFGQAALPALSAVSKARRYEVELEDARQMRRLRDLQMKQLGLEIGSAEALPGQLGSLNSALANIDRLVESGGSGLPTGQFQPLDGGPQIAPIQFAPEEQAPIYPAPLGPSTPMQQQILGPWAGGSFMQRQAPAVPRETEPAPLPADAQLAQTGQAAVPGVEVIDRQSRLLYDSADALERQMSLIPNMHPKAQAAWQASIKSMRDRAERLDKVAEKRKEAPKTEVEISADGTKQRNVAWNPKTGKFDIPIGGWRPVFNAQSLVDVKINTGESFWKEFGKGQAEFLNKQQDKAQQASDAINVIHNMRRNVDSGMFTGLTANVALTFGRALSAAGFEGADDPVANTQAFAAEAGNLVAQIIKEFGAGTGLSDADREYAQKIAAGDITLDEKALRRLLDIREKANRIIIRRYNKRVDQVKKKAGAEGIPFTMDVEEPPVYLPPAGKKDPWER